MRSAPTPSRPLALAALALCAAACSEWPGVGGHSDGGVSGGGRLDNSSGMLGSSCGASGAACTTSLVCVSQFPGGMCTKTCQTDADCSGGACVISNLGLICFQRCTTDQTCRAAYYCASTGTASVCTPGGDGG